MVDDVVTEESINRFKEGVDIWVKRMNGSYHTPPCTAQYPLVLKATSLPHTAKGWWLRMVSEIMNFISPYI
jgi:hypothetical protein